MAKPDLSASPADDNTDVDNAAASTALDDANLDSSPDNDDLDDDETFADAISNALKGDGEDAEGDEDGAEQGKEDPDAATEESGDDPALPDPTKVDDGDDVEPGQRIPYERFRSVIEQRKTVERELESIRPIVDDYRAIQTFMQANELDVNDVSDSLRLAALIKHDPAAALQQLQPTLDELHRFTGRKLPDDLQRRVEVGELSEEDAAELVKARNENERLRQRDQQRDTVTQQQHLQQQVQRARTEMHSAVVAVDKELASKDPDYHKKLPHVQRALKQAIQVARPTTGAQAAALTRKVYAEVSRELAELMPSRPVTQPRPNSGDNVRTAEVDNEPETMDEAIARALRKPVK